MRPPRAAGGRTQRRRTLPQDTQPHVPTQAREHPCTESPERTHAQHRVHALPSHTQAPAVRRAHGLASTRRSHLHGHRFALGCPPSWPRALLRHRRREGMSPGAGGSAQRPPCSRGRHHHDHTHTQKQKHARTRGAPRGPGIRPAPSSPSDPMRLSPGRTLLQLGERWPLGTACGRPPPKPPAQAAPPRPRKAQTPDAAPRPRSRDLGRPLAPTRPGTRQDMATR